MKIILSYEELVDIVKQHLNTELDLHKKELDIKFLVTDTLEISRHKFQVVVDTAV